MVLLSAVLSVILGLSLILEIGARSAQLRWLAKSKIFRKARSQPAAKPNYLLNAFVSVHIPISSEPPDLVISTLRRLNESLFPAFEVIIVDNNTADSSLWRPVELAARELGERFKFVHIDALAGAKAGALNVALSNTDPRATHVAVVDADYQVTSEFLMDGVQALSANDVDYVQFPQAYRRVTKEVRGVEHELGDYFACFSSSSGRLGDMLPTGTLSIFKSAALAAVGGWPTGTITEDADIGVRLQLAGYRGLFIPRERGTGLLPLDFASLSKQRARWASGNMQVLIGLLKRRAELKFRDFLNLAVQLTAWISLWLPAASALALVSLVPRLPLANSISTLAAFTIVASAALTAARLIGTCNGGVADLQVCLGAVVTKIALSWTSAAAWIPALCGSRLRFDRTFKGAGQASGSGVRLVPFLSLSFLTFGIIYLVRGRVLEATACALLASAGVCGQVVDRYLRRSALLGVEAG